MSTDKLEVLKADRSKWKAGPWDGESDREEFTTAAGLPALLVRNPWSGAWCGYVAISPGHPLHGKGNEDTDDVNVHGGITFAGPCRGHVCHVPKPGESDNVWWLGFDTNHGGDATPAGWGGEIVAGYQDYRDEAYLRQECESLAAQLVAMKAPV
jgi:hypothetical protein